MIHVIRAVVLATGLLFSAAAAMSFAAVPGDASASGGGWVANGASACERYLTPDVTGAILTRPADHAQQLDANSCHAGIIYLTLKVADIDVFRLEVPRIFGAHPMDGVGDGAFWNEAGAVSAVKGHDRGCDISIVGSPQDLKIHGEALGQKLGAICNKLFALP